ncbi:MAG: glycerol-3-phosphate dehydrogenase, partial [Actinomycetota bacterium]|nr:glycerol-3-phosphate dehydrogenase [Actinomycetota bacterium]
RHAVVRSPSGLVTVTGGKLTTYRRMAADAVDEVVEHLPGRARRSPTKKMPLRGAAGFSAMTEEGAAARLGINPAVLEHLADRYGGEARTLVAMIQADPTLGEPLVPTLPYLRAEAVYCARYEMAHTLDDILSRRTRALLLARDAAAAAAPDVARLVAPEMGWDDAEVERQVAAFAARAEKERSDAHLPETVLA